MYISVQVLRVTGRPAGCAASFKAFYKCEDCGVQEKQWNNTESDTGGNVTGVVSVLAGGVSAPVAGRSPV